MLFYGRVDENKRKQLLKDHIDGVKSRAIKSDIKGFSKTLELIAVLHDAGKYSKEWQKYLVEDSGKMVAHSTFGMALFDEILQKHDFKLKKEIILLRDLVSYAIGAHHGLYDSLSLDGNWNYERKISRAKINKEVYEDTKLNYFNDFKEIYIEKLIKESLLEMDILFEKYEEKSLLPEEVTFELAMFTRMLLSVIIDSDWSDAASFYDDTEIEWDESYKNFQWNDFAQNLEEKFNTFKLDSELNILRNKISEECYISANRESGIYRLNVPTGGGKSLASMRFALHHAMKKDKKRIIYLAPYKSILEQNAKEYKNILTKDSIEKELFILEHHSDVHLEIDSDNTAKENINQKKINTKIQYLMERWDAPIILTTVVQFLNTLFSDKKQSIRRFNKLSDAIIIIDEFQSIPAHSISLFNRSLNFLANYFNVTIVLTTATQPPFELDITKGAKKIPRLNYEEDIDLSNDYSKESGFLRTKVIDKFNRELLGEEELKRIIFDRMKEVNSLLVIVNTRDTAARIFNKVNDLERNFRIRLLSNNMVPAHRQDVLEEVKELLKDEKVLLISTQLIEAGVDISFEAVIRSLAGLDSIAQSAGRCNRNAEKDLGEVWIVNLKKELENTNKLEEIKIAKETMLALLGDYHKNPEEYENNLLSEKALRFYFEEYLGKIVDKTEFIINKYKKEITIFDLLSLNQRGCLHYREKNPGKEKPVSFLNQAFKTAGENYIPINNQGVTVLVYYKESANLINELHSERGIYEGKKLIRKANRFLLQIPKYLFEELLNNGNIYYVNEIPILKKELYTKIGLNKDRPDDLETMIV